MSCCRARCSVLSHTIREAQPDALLRTRRGDNVLKTVTTSVARVSVLHCTHTTVLTHTRTPSPGMTAAAGSAGAFLLGTGAARGFSVTCPRDQSHIPETSVTCQGDQSQSREIGHTVQRDQSHIPERSVTGYFELNEARICTCRRRRRLLL